MGLLVLADLAETLQAATYEDVVGGACGPIVKTVVDSCIIVYTFGTCIAFLVLIGDQLQDCKSCLHAMSPCCVTVLCVTVLCHLHVQIM